MNCSFVLQGVLIASGAALTWRRWSVLGRIGLVLLIICGTGVIIVGFVPENAHADLHRFGAALHFLAGGLGMMAIGFSLRRLFGWVSVVTGVMVLAATAMLGQHAGINLADKIGTGTLERIAAYGIAGWMALLGGLTYFKRHIP